MRRIRLRRSFPSVGAAENRPMRRSRVVHFAAWGQLGACATCMHMKDDYRCGCIGLDLSLRGADQCSDFTVRQGPPRRLAHTLDD